MVRLVKTVFRLVFIFGLCLQICLFLVYLGTFFYLRESLLAPSSTTSFQGFLVRCGPSMTKKPPFTGGVICNQIPQLDLDLNGWSKMARFPVFSFLAQGSRCT